MRGRDLQREREWQLVVSTEKRDTVSCHFTPDLAIISATKIHCIHYSCSYVALVVAITPFRVRLMIKMRVIIMMIRSQGCACHGCI